jgi:predicted Zn-dependent protease with MMP-like domain
MSISRDEFELLVGEALDSLPPRFASMVENVAVIVEEEPSAEDLRLLDHPDYELLGVFRGTPLTTRSFEMLPMLPNQIAIFRRPILRVTHNRQDALRQIRETVIHELGHYFGLDDHTMVF